MLFLLFLMCTVEKHLGNIQKLIEELHFIVLSSRFYPNVIKRLLPKALSKPTDTLWTSMLFKGAVCIPDMQHLK